MKAQMLKRYCEVSNSTCQSTRCIERNLCARLLGNPAGLKPPTSGAFMAAKIYNDEQLRLFQET